MTPDEYCQEKTQKSSSSFYYSFLFLDDTQRQAMTALYAYCREIDDIVDECSDTYVAANKLNWWRDEVHEIFHGKPNHPVALALTESLKHFPLKESHFLELISGMEMDLKANHYQTFDELSLYCYRVASIVGLMTIEILGYEHDSAREYAHKLGIALQLINILRDVREDAQRGRIYIPQDELKQFDVTPEMLVNGQSNEQTEKLFAFQAQRAEQFYEQAFAAIAPEDRYPPTNRHYYG